MPLPDKISVGHFSTCLFEDQDLFDLDVLSVEFESKYSLLDMEQLALYDAVIQSVYHGSGKLFFLVGPGGTGKTFVYETLIYKLHMDNLTVLPVASSGIAALLLLGGRTTHSRFKIPLNLFDDSVCDIKEKSQLADLLKKASLIIWDEAPMTHKFSFEALDRFLRDIMKQVDIDVDAKPFGGKTILL